jgi:hypothetical protein
MLHHTPPHLSLPLPPPRRAGQAAAAAAAAAAAPASTRGRGQDTDLDAAAPSTAVVVVVVVVVLTVKIKILLLGAHNPRPLEPRGLFGRWQGPVQHAVRQRVHLFQEGEEGHGAGDGGAGGVGAEDAWVDELAEAEEVDEGLERDDQGVGFQRLARGGEAVVRVARREDEGQEEVLWGLGDWGIGCWWMGGNR